MRPVSPQPRGFSLIEIVIALGVAALALVAIIGLLGAALSTSANGGHETLVVAMSNAVLGDLRGAEFDALWKDTPRTQKVITAPTPGVAWADSTYYFSNEGALVDVAKKTDFATTYQCVVKKTPDPTSQLTPASPFNLVRLQLTFTWPVSAHADPAKRPNRQTIYASIARY